MYQKLGSQKIISTETWVYECLVSDIFSGLWFPIFDNEKLEIGNRQYLRQTKCWAEYRLIQNGWSRASQCSIELCKASRTIWNWIDGVYKLCQHIYNKKREFWSSENSPEVKIVVEKTHCDDLA